MEWLLLPCFGIVLAICWALDRKIDILNEEVKNQRLAMTERVAEGETSLSERIFKVESALDSRGFPNGKTRREVETGESYFPDDGIVFLGPTSGQDDN